jgi:hypothetical protein
MLTGAEHEQRQQDVRELFRSVDTVHELADGYAFRFPGDDRFLASLMEFIVVERRCCPFFTFAVIAVPDGGPLWLQLRGSEEIRAFVGGTFVASLANRLTPKDGVSP